MCARCQGIERQGVAMGHIYQCFTQLVFLLLVSQHLLHSYEGKEDVQHGTLSEHVAELAVTMEKYILQVKVFIC